MRRKLGTIGAVITAWQVAMAVREHWMSIPSVRRDRATELLARSRGIPANLSRAERRELRELISGMRLAQLGQRLAGIAFSKRRMRR
jgi:hypothetical protein